MTVGKYIDDNWCFINEVKLLQSLQSNFKGLKTSDELTNDVKKCIDVVIDYEIKTSKLN